MLVEGVSQMLWDFGFRHHPTKQTRWVEGVAGIGTMGKVVDKKPQSDPIVDILEGFLSAENPQLLEAIRKCPEEERGQFLGELEKNYAALGELLQKLKDS